MLFQEDAETRYGEQETKKPDTHLFGPQEMLAVEGYWGLRPRFLKLGHGDGGSDRSPEGRLGADRQDKKVAGGGVERMPAATSDPSLHD